MKISIRTAVVLAALVMSVLVTLAPTANASNSSPFSGVWRGIDSGDGSAQWAVFGPRGTFFYFDESSSACGGPPAYGIGSGAAAGPTWTGTFSVYCTNSTTSFPNIPVFFVFNANDGTLTWTINPGDTWTRVGGS